MRVIQGHQTLGNQEPAHVVGIGIFDGVHRGHQALLGRVLELARGDNLASLAYTFNPHPARVLAKDLAPRLLEPIEQRLTRLAALGLSSTLVETFTLDFARTPADAFVRQVLVGKLRVKHVVVGADFAFGYKQSGNVPMLRALGAELGFTLHPVEIVRVDGIPVTSTKIREFLSTGAVRGATLLLGRPYALSGPVIRGAGRGAPMGLGTANIAPKNEQLPGIGVYAAWADGPFGRKRAVVNVGVAPTFGDAQLKIEAHLLDYDGAPLYDQSLTVHFMDRIRDEKKFDGKDALLAQIAQDIAKGRELLDAAPLEPGLG